MSRPERSKQERRIARGREADAAFDRVYAEALARVRRLGAPGLDTKATPMVYSNYGARNRARTPHQEESCE